MPPRPRLGHISEFVTLVGEVFGTDESVAETVVRGMLVRLMGVAPQRGVAMLFDAVPGARDLAFAGLLSDDDLEWLPEVPRPGRKGSSMSSIPGRVSPDLFVFFLAYCSAHAGVECAGEILAAVRPFTRLERPS